MAAASAPRATTCCIAGGGPAGMMLGLMLARAGIDVVVLEKHKDFFRDFRGDTVHPSTLQVLDDLGLIDRLLALRHSQVQTIELMTADGPVVIGDLSHLPVKYPFIALVPQWDFLNMLAQEARRYPSFSLEMEAQAQELIMEGAAVAGLRYERSGQPVELRAALTVAADGRHSTLRDQAHLPRVESSPPMDVLWFSLSRKESDGSGFLGRPGNGKLIVFIDRFDYWQIGYVIPKGQAQAILARGVDEVKRGLLDLAPEFADRVDELTSVDQLKLLTVQSNRLTRWWLPGFLCIGDAAHAMSPVGGVGINLAIQDAVATANRVWEPLAHGRLTVQDLDDVQRRRTWPTIVTQLVQSFIQKRLISEALHSSGRLRVPGFARFLFSLGFVRELPARFIGVGPRPERPTAELLGAGVTHSTSAAAT